MNRLYIRSFILMFVMFFSSLSFAGLSVKPSIYNIKASTGTVFENKYLVTSSYDTAMTIVLDVSNGNTYSGNKEIDVNKWLKFERKKYDVAPMGTVEVPFKVEVAKDMVGSVSGRVSFTVEQSSMINLAITVPIYVVVEGTEKIDFRIDSLTMSKNERDGGIYYKMAIKNEGNVHIRHSGNIEIYDKKKKNLILNVPIEESVPTYAEQDRVFTGKVVSKDGLKKGKYVAVFKIRDLEKEVLKEVSFKVSRLGEVVTK